MLAVTHSGRAFRITSAGVVTELPHTPALTPEAINTFPNDPAKYGFFAGKLVVGGEDDGMFYTLGPGDAAWTGPIDLGLNALSTRFKFAIEDLKIIRPNSNFYVVEEAFNTVYRASAADLAGFVNDLIVVEEIPSRLWRLHWDGSTFAVSPLATVNHGTDATYFEQGNFDEGDCAPTLAHLCGRVWGDTNCDGHEDAGEPGLVGVKVTLSDGSGPIGSMITGANGTYCFNGLTPGVYTVCVDTTTVPAGYTNSTPTCLTVGVPTTGLDNVDFGFCPPKACVGGDTCIGSNFNGTAIAGGNYIWFNSVLKPSGLGAGKVTIKFINQQITFTSNGVPYTLNVPDAVIVFDPAATTASTSFFGGQWHTTVPTGLSGNTFLSGFSFPVPVNMPGGTNPVTWCGKFQSDTPGVTVNWQWAAAVYNSTFGSDLSVLGVKPVDDNKASIYKNSDHAGVPENKKGAGPLGGARGGGGSNWTGSYSGTGKATPCVP
jgi:hypothetical protein